MECTINIDFNKFPQSDYIIRFLKYTQNELRYFKLLLEFHESPRTNILKTTQNCTGNPKSKVSYFKDDKTFGFSILRLKDSSIFLHNRHFSRCIFVSAVANFIYPCHQSSPPYHYGRFER